jgi:hypothetical protein
MRGLAQDSAWVRNHENVFVIGPTPPNRSADALRRFCSDGQGQGRPPPGPSPIPRREAVTSASLPIIPLDESDHLAGKQNASIASLRDLTGIPPEH